ncbi:MAG: hypothetical protein JKX85_08520 [Phycisphaeraceae bacterium]|nr:hypothetical protein [Phycisphaeraceae bacterium]
MSLPVQDNFFCSVLRCRAARQLADLHDICGNDQTAKEYRAIVENISKHLSSTFAHDSGLLKASTGKSAQADVWGSAFAVYADVLPKHDAKRISQAFLDAFTRGTIAWKSNIRHVPTDEDFSETSVWEDMLPNFKKN